MKKQVWTDVKAPEQLRMGDRVRFADFREHFAEGISVGDDSHESDWRFLLTNGRIGRKGEYFEGYTPDELFSNWNYVQVLQAVDDEQDLFDCSLDALRAVHEVLHDVPEYSAFVTLKDGRQVQVRGMVLAAIEELEKLEKGGAE